MKTRQAICALLDIDAASPKADRMALARLEQLNIRGSKCPRCNGEGATVRGRQSGIQCFPCRGNGYVDFSLSRSALKQLKALHSAGKLDSFHDLWSMQDELRSRLKAFDKTIEDSGIHKAYSAYWAGREQAGSWNFDLEAIHKQIKLARERLFHCVDVAILADQNSLERKCHLAFFRERCRVAEQVVDSLLCERDMYEAWHAKPDYKHMCLTIARKGLSGLHLT